MAWVREIPGLSAPDPRAAASVTLFSVVVCAAAVFALLPRTPSGPATPALSGNRLAEATTAVKVIDAPRSDCAEQAWPYYDRRCLTRRSAAASIGAVPAPQSAAALPPTVSPPSSAAPPSAVPAAKPASPVTARRTTGGSAVTSAPAPETGPVGAAPPANDAAPSSLPAAREPRNEPSSVDMQRGDNRLAAGEDDDPRQFEPVKPVEQPRRRKTRQHHFAIFGLRF